MRSTALVTSAIVALGLAALGCDQKSSAARPEPSAGQAVAPQGSALGRGAAPREGAPSASPTFARVEAPEVAVRASGATVRVRWTAPPGTGINEEAPFKVRWRKSEGLAEAPPEMKSTGASVKDGFDVALKPLAGAPRASLDGEVELVVCDVATHKVCVPVKRALDLGFVLQPGGPEEARLEVRLPEAKAL